MSEPNPGTAGASACRLYLPGHQVHWIQARLAVGDGEHRPEPARLVSVTSDGLVVIDVAGERRRLWHHGPRRLAAVAAANGGRVLHQPRWGLLRCPSASDDAETCFCVADPDGPERVPCRGDGPGGTLVERLAATGGFTASVHRDAAG